MDSRNGTMFPLAQTRRHFLQSSGAAASLLSVPGWLSGRVEAAATRPAR
ncbi:MAG TPA: hypothetical protein DCY79_11215, partial [Planctomycetaceae bacterium]|nr:hypothetical protein [Planctomycetaceae bacterium]